MVHQCLPGAYEGNRNLKVQRIETPIILDLRVSMVCFVFSKSIYELGEVQMNIACWLVGLHCSHSMLAHWIAVALTACWLAGLQFPLCHVIVLQAVPASSLLLSYGFLAFHWHYWFRSKLIELEKDLECGPGNHSNYRNRCINSVKITTTIQRITNWVAC